MAQSGHCNPKQLHGGRPDLLEELPESLLYAGRKRITRRARPCAANPKAPPVPADPAKAVATAAPDPVRVQAWPRAERPMAGLVR
jgi:hypothetical protein